MGNKKVRLGIIGCGNIARAHLRNLLSIPEVDLVAFADPNLRAAGWAANQSGKGTIFADWREMLDRTEMDGVLILTPHAFHFEQIITALRRDLHVLVEKPMVTTIEEAERVIQTAQERKRVVVVSYQRRFFRGLRFLRESIARGDLGELNYSLATLRQNWKRMTEGTWRQEPKLSGGGALMDSGSHLIDVTLWCFQDLPVAVSAMMNRQGTPVDIFSSVTFRFPGGALAVVNILGDCPVFHESYLFVGTEGALHWQDGQLLWERAGQKEAKEIGPETLPSPPTPDHHFIELILGRAERNESPPEDALKVITVTSAAYTSVETGQIISLKGEK